MESTDRLEKIVTALVEGHEAEDVDHRPGNPVDDIHTETSTWSSLCSIM